LSIRWVGDVNVGHESTGFSGNFEEQIMTASDCSVSLANALIEVAKVRFAMFRERFGRDPEPDEPLLFDPGKDEPTAASSSDRRLQLLSAAVASNVDAAEILDYFDCRSNLH
jgi:hypothetical protein